MTIPEYYLRRGTAKNPSFTPFTIVDNGGLDYLTHSAKMNIKVGHANYYIIEDADTKPVRIIRPVIKTIIEPEYADL